jgi:RimJ/RimL family protein N-acetyltransferase
VRFLRPATGADRTLLASFSCADPERRFEVDVELFVRSALDWQSETGGCDRQVLVVDEGGELVAVVMHEQDDADRFVNALAVRRDRRGEGLGTEALGSALADIGNRRSGMIVTWLVHPANFASHIISDRLGAAQTWPPEDKPHARYVIAVWL